MPGIDVSRVVNNPLFQVPFQLERNVYEFMNEGEYTLVATNTFNMVGGIRPASTSDRVAHLPEGQRELDAIKVFATSPLLMADGNGQESDVIIWKGRWYRVQFSKPYQSYWFAIATGFVHGS
jgi:hypothetical protein